MKYWTFLKAKLAGRKTYLVSALVVVVTLALVYVGKLTPETATTVALIALGLFAATFRASLAAHLPQILALLTLIAEAGAAARSHDKATEIAAAEGAASAALELNQDLDAGNEGGSRL